MDRWGKGSPGCDKRGDERESEIRRKGVTTVLERCGDFLVMLAERAKGVRLECGERVFHFAGLTAGRAPRCAGRISGG